MANKKTKPRGISKINYRTYRAKQKSILKHNIKKLSLVMKSDWPPAIKFQIKYINKLSLIQLKNLYKFLKDNNDDSRGGNSRIDN